WSPDGGQIAYLGAPVRGGSGHTDLYVVAANPAREAARLLTGEFVPVCEDRCINDMREHVDPHLFWSPDGQEVYFLASLRGTTHLYAARPAEDSEPRAVTSGARHVYGFSVDKAGQMLALGIADPANPGDVYAQQLDGEQASELHRLTELNAALLAEVELAP